MESKYFDNVKAEKIIAMEMYRRRTKFKLMFELCLALFLASQSSGWFPAAAQLFRRLVFIFNSPFYVFMLFNFVILVVYFLSVHQKSGGNFFENDFSEELVKNGESRTLIDGDDESTESVDEKQIICADNAAFPIDDRTVTVITVTEGSISPIRKDPDHEITKNESRLNRCRRTQSARFDERMILEKPHREFRRSETVRIVDSEGKSEKRVCSVEEMNDDEFKNTVEAFIAEQKWIQMEEHREEQRANHTPLALCW